MLQVVATAAGPRCSSAAVDSRRTKSNNWTAVPDKKVFVAAVVAVEAQAWPSHSLLEAVLEKGSRLRNVVVVAVAAASAVVVAAAATETGSPACNLIQPPRNCFESGRPPD